MSVMAICRQQRIVFGWPTIRELARLLVTRAFVGTNPENAANFCLARDMTRKSDPLLPVVNAIAVNVSYLTTVCLIHKE